jgi:hypothetical protein
MPIIQFNMLGKKPCDHIVEDESACSIEMNRPREKLML